MSNDFIAPARLLYAKLVLHAATLTVTGCNL